MKSCGSAAAKKPSLDSGFGAEAPATTSSTANNCASKSSSAALEVQQLPTVRPDCRVDKAFFF